MVFTRLRQPASLPVAIFILLVFVCFGLADAQQEPMVPYELEGHEGPINSVSYTPNGVHVLTASSDMTIRLWESLSGKEIRVLSGHTGQVTSLAVDPSGRMAFSGASDNTIRLWDLPKPDPLLELAAGKGLLRAVGMSPDSSLLLTGGDDKIVRVWTLADSKPQFELTGHLAKILDIAYRADANQFASSDLAGVVKLWDPLQRIEIHQFGAHQGEVRFLAYHPNNQQLITAGEDGVVRTWQLAVLPSRQLPVHAAAVSRLRFSANNQSLLTSDGQQISIYNVADKKLLRVLEGQAGQIVAINRANNDSVVASGNANGQLRFWNLANGEERFTVQASGQPISDVVFHPDNVRVTSSHRDGTVHAWKLPTKAIPLPGHTAGISAIAIRPDGQQIASGAEDMSVRLWNPAGGANPIVLAGHASAISQILYRPDGQQLVSSDGDGVFKVWNSANGELVVSVQAHPVAITGMSYHPQGNALVTSAADGSWKRWSLPFVAARPLAGTTESVDRVVMTSDGSLLFVGGAGKAVRVFNGANGQPVRTLEGQVDGVTALKLDPANQVVATGSDTGILRFWNVADGASRLQLAGHLGPVRDVALLAESKGVLSAGEDGTIRQWRMPVAPRPHAGHSMPVGVLAASQDGMLLLTGSADKSVRLWNRTDGAAAGTMADHQEAISAITLNVKKDMVVSGDRSGIVYIWPQAEGVAAERLLGHTSPVIGLGFASQETTLLSASEDGAIRYWKLPLVPVRELVQQDPVVNALLLGNDSMTAIIGAGDAGARLVNARTGDAIRLLEGQDGAVTSVTLSASQDLAAAGTANGSVQLWNSEDGSAVATLRGHVGPITGVRLGKEPGQVFTAGDDGTIRLWQVAPEPEVYEDRMGELSAIAYSADGTLVAIAMPIREQAGILIRELASGKVLHELLGHQAPVISIAFNWDASRLVSGSSDKTLRVWDLEDTKFSELASFEHPGPVTAVCFDRNAEHAFGASSDNGIHQWNIADGSEVRVLAGHGGAISSLLSVQDLVVSGAADNTVRSWNATTGAAAGNINNTAAVTSLAVTSDGITVAAGSADNMVRLWTRANGSAAGILAGHTAAVTAVRFDAKGGQLISVSAQDIRLWNTTGLQREVQMAGEIAPSSASFLAETDVQQQIAVVQVNGRVEIGATTVVSILVGHEGAVTGLAVNLAETSVFSSGIDKTVRQWDLASQKQLRTFSGPTDLVNCLALAKEGGRLFAGSSDKNVYSWQVPLEGEEPTIAPTSTLAHDGAVRGVSTNADGSRLAAVGDDKLVTVWDVATGLILQQGGGHTEAVLAVSLSNDGTTLVSGSADKTAHWWQLAATQVVVADSKQLVGFDVASIGQRAVSAGGDKVLRVWSAVTGENLLEIPLGEQAVQAISIAADGSQVAVADATGLKRWLLDMKADELTAGAATQLVTEASVVAVDYAADGTILAVTADNQVLRIDTGTGLVTESIALAGPTTSVIAVSANEEGMTVPGVLVTDANQSLLHLVSIESILVGHEGAVTGVAVDGAGKFAFSSGVDMTVRQWELASGKQVRTFGGPTDQVNSLALAAEGGRLFAGSSDKNLYSWQVPVEGNGAEVAPTSVLEHKGAVRGVSSNLDGSRLAAVGDDGLVTVWDLATGLVLQQLDGHTENVLDVSLSADGATVVSGSADKTARWWQLAAQQVVAADAEKLLAVQYSRDGTELFTSGQVGGVVRWKLEAGESAQFTAVPAVRLALAGEQGDLVVAGMDGAITRWSLESGEQLATITTTLLAQDIKGLSMSVVGDGSRVAVGHGTSVQLFGLDNGELLESFLLPTPVTASVISLDGTRMVIGQKNAEANLDNYPVSAIAAWRVTDKQVLAHTLSPNGQLIFAAIDDGTVQMRNLVDGELVRTFGTAKEVVSRISVSANGQTLAVASSDKHVYLWQINPENANDLAADEVVEPSLALEHPGPVTGVDFSNNSARLATSCSDGRVRVFNREDGQLLEWFEPHQESCLDVDFMDDRTCASGGMDKRVHLQSTSVVAVYAVFDKPIRAAQLVAGGAQLLLADPDGEIVLLNLANGQPLRKFEGAKSPVLALAAAPNGSQLVASTEDQRLLLWTMADGTLKAEIKMPSPVTLAHFSSDSLKIATAAADDHLRVYGSEDLRELYELVSDQPIVSLLFQSDNRHLFTGHANGVARKWLYSSPDSVKTFTGHGGTVYGLAINSDASLFASASQDQTIRIWNVEAGNQLKQLSGHQGAVYSVAFSKDGSLLVSCGADKTMRLWDVLGGRQLKQISAGDAGLYSVTLNPDGKRAAVAGLDKKIRVYDVFTGQLLNTLEKHKDYVYRVTYNGAGDRLLSCGYGGHVVLWNGTSGEPLFEHEFNRVSNYADLAPDGSRIIVAGGEGTGRFVDVPPESR
jgi:WD40 repeat protein